MEKQQLIEKTVETLRPFETDNLIATFQHMTFHQMLANPFILFLIVVIFIYGFMKRSKPVLLGLFTLFFIALIMRFAMPVPGDSLTFASLLPFVGGGLVVGGVIIYFSLIKSD